MTEQQEIQILKTITKHSKLVGDFYCIDTKTEHGRSQLDELVKELWKTLK